MRLAIVATHPIQYHVAWYRGLAARDDVDLTVWFGSIPTPERQGVGFDVAFEWDVPVLEGYPWKRLPVAGSDPSLSGFLSIRTSGVGALLDAERPDAVVLTGWQSLSLVQTLLACRRRGIPTLVRAESNALKPRPWWVRAIHRTLLARFDGFLAIGRANERFYLDAGVAPERIFPAPYFVDGAFFEAERSRLEPDRDAIRAAWGIPPSSTCFLFVGKLQPKKRPADLLEAFARVHDADPEARLLVVGTGPLEAELRARAAELDLPVVFAGFLNQTEIGRAYVAGDCLVFPSDWGETWGLVVNEAMIFGVPAIVSDRVGCGPDLVEPGETGWRFPFGDVAVLADRMLEAASDGAALRRTGERARRRVAAHSVERTVASTVEAARWAASGGRLARGAAR